MVKISELAHDGAIRRKVFEVSGANGSGRAVLEIKKIAGVVYRGQGVFVISPKCADPYSAWFQAHRIVEKINTTDDPGDAI